VAIPVNEGIYVEFVVIKYCFRAIHVEIYQADGQILLKG